MDKERDINEVIKEFLEGRDPQERIVNITYKNTDNYVTVFFRNENDEKCSQIENFYPFCWATRYACVNLCGGDRTELKKIMSQYGIGVKKLSNTDYNGNQVAEFEKGYMFMFFAKKPMSYINFLNFFKKCKNPIFNKKDKDGNDIVSCKEQERQYLIVSPQEQFLISTVKRFFKSYNDYDNLLRMIFDLETEGLNPEKDRIKLNGVKLNRNITIRGKEYKNWGRIFHLEGETKEEKDKSELGIIDTMLKLIYTFKPDIITAHNGENFDWNFLITRCKVLGTSMEEMSKKYFNGDYIMKEERESVLKLGGEIESFHRTIVPNTIITDSLHAVRRAQATDSNFKQASLKYATKYLNLKKENRVYTPGNEIDKILIDTKNKYAFNDKNGDWYIYDETCENNKSTQFKLGKDGDKPFIIYRRNYIADGYEIVTGKYIIERYLKDDLWECDKVESKLNTANFFICKILPVPFSKCCTMGTAGQWKAIMMGWSYENNLAIPIADDEKLTVGGLSRLLNVGYSKNIIKLDYNSLYPSITLTWGIEDWQDLSGVTLKMLEYVLTEREKYKALKKNADKIISKYDEMIKSNIELSKEDKEVYEKAKADFSINDKIQNSFKILGNSYFGSVSATNSSVFPWKSSKIGHQITCIGRQCLRLMISHFHDIKGPNGETDGYGYKPLVGDTDGFNFELPQKFRYTKDNPYISTGLSRCTKKGVAYTGYEADLAEFNDKYLIDFHYSPNAVQKMGCDVDEIISASLNLSRKNYVDYFAYKPEGEQFKLVGNTIKSKKLQTFIEKFLNIGLPLLVLDKGQDFINEYYDYINKIYNYKIPLRDIASKGKIKKSLDEYKRDIKQITKAGRPKSRQAWYELAIKDNLLVNNGDTVYYINTGKSKSHNDIKKITHYYVLVDGVKTDITKDIESGYKKYKKENNDGYEKNKWIEVNYPSCNVEEEIIFNCMSIGADIIESEQDIFCNDENGIEYNTAKYIDMFNKRIKPLLVCFSKSIRDKILINEPNERQYFTEEECKLCSGEPNKPGDQDTYEQLMTMEDKEIAFWAKYNLIPPFVEECGMGKWTDIVDDYFKRKEREKELGIEDERMLYDKIVNSLTDEEINDFIEDGKIPTRLNKIIELDPDSNNIMSSKYPNIVLGTIYDIIDRENNDNKIID